MPQRPLVGGVDVIRNSEGERIFMNEVKLLSPPPWRFLAVNEKCKSRQPKQKARVISSNGNLERFCLIWTVDYVAFYCLNHVNEPSGLLRKPGLFRVQRKMRLGFAIHRHAIVDSHSCKAPRMQKLRHRISPETAENAAIKIK